MEGRDIGTVIMPDADLKVFLTCDPEERVRRRAKDGNLETVEELEARDRQDSERATAPLKKAEGAMEIDTTNLQIEQVVENIVGALHRRRFLGVSSSRFLYDSKGNAREVEAWE